jgi:AcrR family transcriptional regulator
MVAPPQATLSAVGDDHNSKRRQILDGARAVFLDLGFDGASMGEIARAAGVSKGTLYVYFVDKNALFAAIVEEEILEHGRQVFEFAAELDIEAKLRGFARAHIQMLCRPRAASAVRTVMAIAERMPELGRSYYERVILRTNGRLATYLEQHVASGELRIDDCAFAAAQFIQLCQASLFLPFLFQAVPVPTPERVEAVVDSATRIFLSAYRKREPEASASYSSS